MERQRLDAMGRRLHQLEAVVRELPRAVGTVVGKHVAKAIEAHPGMVYRGVWSETQSYPAGTVITDKSSAWVAITPAKPGERPSRAPSWRLMAKGAPEQQGTFS